MYNVLVLVYANKDHPGLLNLVRTLRERGFNYRIIGRGEKWINFSTLAKGLYDELTSLHSSQIVCKLDAFDMYAVGTPDELGQKWAKFGKDMVVGAESLKLLYPQSTKYYHYYQINADKLDYPYFNAGCIIGRAGKLAHFYKWLLDNEYTDDQVGLNDYANKFPQDIALDHTQSIVGNTTIVEHLQQQEGRVYNPKTGEWPVFLHIPGTNWDWWYRMDKHGRYLLGEQYREISTREKVTVVWQLFCVKAILIIVLVFVLCYFITK